MRPRPARGHDTPGRSTTRERGSLAVPVAFMLLGALFAGSFVALAAGSVAAASARAQVAADLAALGGLAVSPLVGGDGSLCPTARRVAEANGATLVDCTERASTESGALPGSGLVVRVEATPGLATMATLMGPQPAEAAAALAP